MPSSGYYATQTAGAFMSGIMEAYNRHTAMMADITRYENVIKQQNRENQNADFLLGLQLDKLALEYRNSAAKLEVSGLDPSKHRQAADEYAAMARQRMASGQQRSGGVTSLSPVPAAFSIEKGKLVPGGVGFLKDYTNISDAFLEEGIPFKINGQTEFESRMSPGSPGIKNPDGTVSSRKMAWAELDNGYIAYPTVVNIDGELKELGKQEAMEHAVKNREYELFNTAKEAEEYAAGSWKKKGAPRAYNLPDGTDPRIFGNLTQESKDRFMAGIEKGMKRIGGLKSREGVNIFWNNGSFTKAVPDDLAGTWKEGTDVYSVPAASVEEKLTISEIVKSVAEEMNGKLYRTGRDLRNAPDDDEKSLQAFAQDLFTAVSNKVNTLYLKADTPQMIADEIKSIGLVEVKAYVKSMPLREKQKEYIVNYLDSIASNLGSYKSGDVTVTPGMVEGDIFDNTISRAVNAGFKEAGTPGLSIFEMWPSRVKRRAEINTITRGLYALRDKVTGESDTYNETYGEKGIWPARVSQEKVGKALTASIKSAKEDILLRPGVWQDVANQYEKDDGTKYILGKDEDGKPTEDTEEFLNRFVVSMLEQETYDRLNKKGISRHQVGTTEWGMIKGAAKIGARWIRADYERVNTALKDLTPERPRSPITGIPFNDDDQEARNRRARIVFGEAFEGLGRLERERTRGTLTGIPYSSH